MPRARGDRSACLAKQSDGPDTSCTGRGGIGRTATVARAPKCWHPPYGDRSSPPSRRDQSPTPPRGMRLRSRCTLSRSVQDAMDRSAGPTAQRTPGDKSKLLRATPLPTDPAPHARGWIDALVRHRARRSPRPACAGMDRWVGRTVSSLLPTPRARGDRSQQPNASIKELLTTPHSWGSIEPLRMQERMRPHHSVYGGWIAPVLRRHLAHSTQPAFAGDRSEQGIRLLHRQIHAPPARG